MIRAQTRRVFASGVVATAVLLAGRRSAQAQTFGTDDRGPQESYQNFAVELRAGAWFPAVDTESGLTGMPAQEVFGTGQGFSAGAEFDWQIVRIGRVMSLGVGAGLNFARVSGAAPFTDRPAERSTEETALNVVPMNLVAVARFDGLARHNWWFPLVPYAKAGLAYSIWWVTNGRGTAHDTNGSDAVGGSFGVQLAAGLALSLEVFEPSAQRQWDASSGVNHSYLFFEVYGTSILGGGQLNVGTLNWGPATWSAGLAIEF